MIITCPECETRFMISDQALGEDGRTVRCSKCAHTWHQSPEDIEDSGDLVDVEENDVLSEDMEEYEGQHDEEEDDGQFPMPSDEEEGADEPKFEVPIPESIHPRSESLIEEEIKLISLLVILSIEDLVVDFVSVLSSDCFLRISM